MKRFDRNSVSFFSGFLAWYVQEHSIADCILRANYSANLVIQRSGCTLPPKNQSTVSFV